LTVHLNMRQMAAQYVAHKKKKNSMYKILQHDAKKRTETSLCLHPVPKDENQLRGVKIRRYHRDSSLVAGGTRQHHKTVFQK